MKFQDSSFNGLKVTVGTKSVTPPYENYSKTTAVLSPNTNKTLAIILFFGQTTAILIFWRKFSTKDD